MHESSLARQILDVVLARAAGEGAHRIRLVRGWVAETETLSVESLGFHFTAHARGTAAEDAKLALRLVHVQARCRSCAHTYCPEHHVLVCPACGSTEGNLLGETGLGIDSVEVD
jgi:hydrogenase nickel incorporation protein HypA/HybF